MISGIECRKCDRTSWKTRNTRRADRAIRRRKECKCGHRITTIETIVNDTDEIGKTEIKAGQATNA